jgi:hypothetical protein
MAAACWPARTTSDGPSSWNHEKTLRRIPPGARVDLLRVEESDSRVRSDVIRQFHERPEEDVLIRLQVIDLLHRLES